MGKPQKFDFDECLRKLRSRHPDIYEDGFGMITDFYGGENRVPQYTDRIIELIRQEKDAVFKGRLIELLGYSHDPKVIPVLLAESDDPQYQSVVINALTELGGPEAAALADKLSRRADEEPARQPEKQIGAAPAHAGPLRPSKSGAEDAVPSPSSALPPQERLTRDWQPQRFGPSFFSRLGLVSLAIDALPFVVVYLGCRTIGLLVLLALFLLHPFVLLNLCWVTVDSKKIVVSRLGRRQMVLLDTIKKVIPKSEYEWGAGGSFWPRQRIILDSDFKRVEIDTTAWTADVEEELLALLSEAGLDFGFRLKSRGLRDSFSSDPDEP